MNRGLIHLLSFYLAFNMKKQEIKDILDRYCQINDIFDDSNELLSTYIEKSNMTEIGIVINTSGKFITDTVFLDFNHTYTDFNYYKVIPVVQIIRSVNLSELLK